MAEQAAEYPEGLCDALASEYRASDAEVGRSRASVELDQGTVDDMEPLRKRARRELENKHPLGGMRAPHLAVTRVPGWKATGTKLAEALGPIVLKHLEAISAVFQAAGSDKAAPIPSEIVHEAQMKLEEAFGLEAGRTGAAECIPYLRGDIMAALIKEPGDPDDVLPQWVDGRIPRWELLTRYRLEASSPLRSQAEQRDGRWPTQRSSLRGPSVWGITLPTMIMWPLRRVRSKRSTTRASWLGRRPGKSWRRGSVRWSFLR